MQTGPKTQDKFSIPGLAERPPPPVPQVSAFPAASTTASLPAASDDPPNIPSSQSPVHTPSCSNCIPRQETLVAAFQQLRAAQRRVNSAIILGKEAVERSNAKIGAYDSLYTVYQKYGKPFQDGDRLPEEFMRDYPRHDHEDAIREGTRLRQEKGEDKRQRKGKASKKSDGGEEDRGQPKRAGIDRGHPNSGGTKSAKRVRGHPSTRRSVPSDNGEESEETIPDEFRDSEHQRSEDSSVNLYDGDSEADGDWELDPDADEG